MSGIVGWSLRLVKMRSSDPKCFGTCVFCKPHSKWHIIRHQNGRWRTVIFRKGGMVYTVPKDPITFSDDDWVCNHLLRKVFRFHYHSQKVIGSLGSNVSWLFHLFPIIPHVFTDVLTGFPRPSFRHQAIQLLPSLSVLDVSRSCPNCPWTLWQWQCLEATSLEVTGWWK